MENKYFTPEESDIRLDYELEYRRNGEWHKWVLGRRNEVSNALHLMSEPKMDGPQVRVPYLTKEQIETEGWEQMGDYFSKDRKRLTYYDNRLKIFDMFDNMFYSGECKDINTLRAISKLLGIKKEE